MCACVGQGGCQGWIGNIKSTLKNVMEYRSNLEQYSSLKDQGSLQGSWVFATSSCRYRVNFGYLHLSMSKSWISLIYL